MRTGPVLTGPVSIRLVLTGLVLTGLVLTGLGEVATTHPNRQPEGEEGTGERCTGRASLQ